MRNAHVIISLATWSFLIGGCSAQAAPSNPMTPHQTRSIKNVVQIGQSPGWQIFPSPVSPFEDTPGKDGAVWFSSQSDNVVGRIDMVGNISTFPLHGTPVGAITRNQDGNVYAAEKFGGNYAIARITPQGGTSDLILPSNVGFPGEIVSGSDGNLWIASGLPSALGRLTLSGQYTDFTGTLSGVSWLAAGTDKNIWATGFIGNQPVVAKVNISDGSMTTFSLPGDAQHFLGIVAGADGGMWVADESTTQMIRVDPTTGKQSLYPGRTDIVSGGVAGPNRFLYYHGHDKVYEFGVDHHQFHAYFLSPSQCRGTITIGPDGQLWAVGERVMCVYVLHPIVTVPQSVVVSVGNSTGLAVSEPRSYQKSFSVVSSDPSIATVVGSGTSFTVTGVRTGSTTLVVSDSVGNSVAIPVAVN